MCMGGSSGGGAVITAPNTGGYDAMLAMQQSAMQNTMQNGMMQAQQSLQSAIQQQQMSYRRIADAKTAMANDQAALNEQAMRMSQLQGPPPPEETAKAPKVGDRDRYGAGAEGKSALRIGKNAGKKKAAGSGLSINI